MKGNNVGACFGEIRNKTIDRFDHQVDINRHFYQRADGGAYHGANGQVRNVVIVHHIEMDHVRAGSDDITYFLAQLRKIG